jgi:hypothetical protein
MTHQIAVTPKGYQVYRTVNGRYRLDVGPAWGSPKEAARYADLLDTPTVSPLRGPESPVPLADALATGAHGRSQGRAGRSPRTTARPASLR